MKQFTRVFLFMMALLLGGSGMLSVRAQSGCGCDFILNLNNANYQFDGLTALKPNGTKIQPGDTICFTSGTRWGYGFHNLHGTAENPIVITNMCNGQVILNSPSGWGNSVEFVNCSNVKFTGSNNPDVEYGITVKGASHGVNFHTFSTDVEMDHIKVDGVGSNGIVAKTDPNCTPATWRESGFVMRNVRIHDNYVANTVDEGIYIGNSHYDVTVKKVCSGDTIDIRETPCDYVYVYNNVIDNVGNEGIQAGGAFHVFIHDNRINNFANYDGGKPRAKNDENGIQCGQGTTGATVYNNVLTHGRKGFYDAGGGGTYYNNVLSDAIMGGFVLSDYANLAPSGFRVFNNTLVNVASPALAVYNTNADFSLAYNNILVGVAPSSGSYEYIFYNHQPSNHWTLANNIQTLNVNTVGFVNAAGGDYRLTGSSAGVNAGLNVSAYGVTFDIDGNPRPLGSAFDIGAYEFVPAVQESRFFFSPTARAVSGWINLAGQPHVAPIAASDPATGISVSSIAASQWSPGVFSGTTSSAYDGGVTNGTVQPTDVVLGNWFNYNAPYGSTVNGIAQTDNIRVSGLIPSQVYTLQIGASRRSGATADQYGASEYRFNGTNPHTLTVTNNAANQLQVTATSDSQGRIGISARRPSGGTLAFGYIGWLVVTQGNTAALQAGLADVAEQPITIREESAKIYPNPASAYFVADLRSFRADETVQISIVNQFGHAEVLGTAQGGQLQRMETDRVTNGVFTVVLSSGSQKEQQRVMIKK